MSKWTEFVKDFARRHNLSYGCALSDKRCSQEYKQYKIDELNIPEIPKIIKKKFKEKPKLIPEISEIPKIIKKKFKEKPKLIPEIQEIPKIQEISKIQEIPKIQEISKKSKRTPYSERRPLTERLNFFSKDYNIPIEDAFKSKQVLEYMYKKDLIEISKSLGLKVSKYDDNTTLINKILKFTTN